MALLSQSLGCGRPQSLPEQPFVFLSLASAFFLPLSLPKIVELDMESRAAMDGQPISFAASPTEAALAFASDTYKLVVISFDDAPDLPTPDAGKRKGRRRTAVERFQTSGPQRLPTAKARVVDTCRHEDGTFEGMGGGLRCDLFSYGLKGGKDSYKNL